ncbi:hypothetical protein EJB05_43014 [Eragrostis curvula]|uniref:Uncharacterized protein n=1 Tax=Eragrostis curvula TaxID=38414 RepID=A0A5J9TE24_9POAL|nr:hypothetical protein EJB05_43014 [Eragrostis curvula]
MACNGGPAGTWRISTAAHTTSINGRVVQIHGDQRLAALSSPVPPLPLILLVFLQLGDESSRKQKAKMWFFRLGFSNFKLQRRSPANIQHGQGRCFTIRSVRGPGA